MPSYLQDEDEEQLRRDPFYGPDDEEDAFDTGATSEAGAPPRVAAPPPSGLTPQAAAIFRQPGRAPGNSYETEQANKAHEDLAAAKAHVPVPAQPKWWQRVAAGAVGGLAGETNAAGRTHVDAGPAVQNILGAGKYQRDLAQYNADVTGAQARVDSADTAESRWWKNRQLNSQEDLHAAQAQQAEEHAAYWRHRAELEQNQWKADSKGNLYNTVTGEVHQKSQSPREHLADLVAAGYSQDEAKIIASGGHLGQEKPAPNANEWQMYLDAAGGDNKKALEMYRGDKIRIARESRPPRPESGPKPPTSAQMQGVERKKNDRLNGLEVSAKRELQAINTKPVIGPNGQQVIDPKLVAADRKQRADAVYAQLEQEKQRIQNEYEGEIQAATGNYPGHVDLKPTGQAAPPAAPPAPPAAPPPAAPPPATGVTPGGNPYVSGGSSGPKPPDAAIAEGTVVRNPKTGERRILKGGQWVPL